MADDPERVCPAPTITDIGTDKGTGNLEAAGPNAEPQEGRARKKRLQLSCGECVQLEQIKSDQAEIRILRNELFQLRELLSKPTHQDRAAYTEDAQINDISKGSGEVDSKEIITNNRIPINANNDGPPDPREKSPRGYYRRHTLLRFFSEKAADQWLKPYGIHIKKNKSARDDSWRMKAASQEQPLIESILPPKSDTDVLVSIYLNHFEQLHRVVHVPTFNREYINFWTPGRTQYPTMAAMILSMLAVAICAPAHLVGSSPVPAAYRNMAEQWISSIDDWLRLQSSKHRKLVHYQVACLMYVARRMNVVHKKKFWKDTGSLIQDAIMDGLHRNPPMTDTFFISEMKKRMWYTIRELELQNSFECGLPTLLHSIESNVSAPINLADEDFDDTTKQAPMTRPPNHYTEASYQFHSFRSWALRLEISRRLFGSGAYRALDYEEVLRFTHEVTKAINDLPPWSNGRVDNKNDPRLLLTFSMLGFQLKECLLAIHRPYIDRDDGKYWVSENICYQTSREIVVSSIELANLGVQSLAQLREDLALASLHVTRVTLLQPEGSTSIIMANAMSTVDLLEQCLPIIEDKYLRCCDPWIFFIMCTAIMLIKMHLGKESRQTAKSSCARRFLDLYYKNVWMRQPSDLAQQQAITQDIVNQTNASAAYPPPPPDGNALPTSAWLDSSYPDIGNDPFDLAVELDNVWSDSGFPLPGFPNC
ncbi:zn2 cys6 dna-binding [Trichoderma arundinaceum]|uniref:Zn2 cys6 dna-binding n=1 Tax=Trichoderma arundinaceum TaxID=490622 RepID=A0A395NG66_TRIAR|nr:zn2 cys6 dna-binding [Trichoderma arundinaceum]